MFGRVYTAITLVFFVFLVAFGVFRVRAERSERLEDAQTRFSILASAVRGGLSGNEGAPAERIAAAVRPRIDPESGLDIYLVYTLDRGIEYLWSRDSGLLPRGVAGAQPASLAGETTLARAGFSSPISAAGTSPVYIADASFDVLPPSAVATVLRESLLILLVYLGVTITALVVFVLRNRVAEAIYATEAATRPVSWTAEHEPPAGTARTTDPPKAGATKNASPQGSQPPQESPPEAPTDGKAEETGLFDPNTGIGYRKHFEPRLSLELDRAAENDDDLSLMLVMSRSEDTSARTGLYRILIRTYEYQDLVFHYENNGVAVVLPRKSLTEALAGAEDFVAVCDEQKVPRPLVGLSSRNGRIVEGNRLIGEAEGALSKAQSESATIVGFHPDPQAYRNFLSRGSRHSAMITGP